ILVEFVRGDLDVLLCTTIIESGVDMPNVNTILIDRADRFGLSDLYQLRGRVGRYKHKAYAYLLLPRHGRLFDTARKRIGALRRHTALGAGFRLALRDLELRGAGNLLGAQQSGHVSAVGFDLYCRLLRRAVEQLKGGPRTHILPTRTQFDFLSESPAGNPERSAVIPADYVEDEDLRIALYRKIAAAETEAEIGGLEEDCADRFGRIPEAMRRLFLAARIRRKAGALGIDRVETRGDQLILLSGGIPWMPRGRYPRLTEDDPTRRLRSILDQIGSWNPS
ncbi:MAG: TRCF domain-containing protein, partial [Kiritimatiellia bacterium]|nr:TRCF domain-containing protein [Kiritimatiellia bacterium]